MHFLNKPRNVDFFPPFSYSVMTLRRDIIRNDYSDQQVFDLHMKYYNILLILLVFPTYPFFPFSIVICHFLHCSLWPFCRLFSRFLSHSLFVVFFSQFQVICPTSWGDNYLSCRTHTKTLSVCLPLSLTHTVHSPSKAPANALQHYYSARS